MKYVCLGYYQETRWNAMSESERKAYVSDCSAYDELLRKEGHMLGGEALGSVSGAVTVRGVKGRVTVTDGPFAETKEQLGGIMVLEARDLNEAIRLMSKHPGLREGCFEIRPAADLPT